MATIRLRFVNGFANKHRKDARPRYYFRRPGAKAIPLPGRPGSAEFMQAYDDCLATVPNIKPSAIGSNRTGPGTINALAVAFYQTTIWNSLAASSRGTYRPIIEAFRERHGHRHVATLQAKHVGLALDEVAKPLAKRKLLKAIRLLMKVAIPSLRGDDPTAGIKITVPKSKGWHCWSDEEVAVYRAHHPLGTAARLVMEFALETASRRGEITRLGPQHIRGGRIRIERTHGSRDVNIPLTPELKAAIEAMPKAKHLTFVVGKHGGPINPDSLAQRFRQLATEAGLPGNCRLHGLKKGGMRRIAEKGASAHMLMSWSGHKTLQMVQHYTDDFDRTKLADETLELMRPVGTRSRSVPEALTNTGTPDLQTPKKTRA
jgi:integrase